MPKKTAKRTTKKKTATRSAAAPKPSYRITGAERARSKSEVYGLISEQIGITRKQVGEVFDVMRAIIEKDLGKRGPGVFSVPGMMKLRAVRKPAERATTRANPFKPGEMMKVKAKPPRTLVKIRPLKALKDSI